MKSNSLTRQIAFVLVIFYAGITNIAFSQLPASLEKEFIQFYSDIYNALKIIDTQNEKDAVKKLGEIKPKLNQEAESLFFEAKLIFENVSGKESQDYAICCSNIAGLFYIKL